MNNENKVLVLLNTITMAIMLFANYASNSGMFSNLTVGEISHKYDTLFAPAGYAFFIWSIIFLFCIGFVINQWLLLKKNDAGQYIQRTGTWFAISNLANAFWLYCWTNELMGWSVIVILLLLFCLCVLTVRLRLELDDEPVRTIIFVWWPIVIYLGWIMVATIACIASWLVYNGWHGGSTGEDVWTILLVAVATMLYLFLVIKRNLREAAMVGVWAFVAIAIRQWNVHFNIAIAAILASTIIFAVTALHAYKNRFYNLGDKLKRGEWQ